MMKVKVLLGLVGALPTLVGCATTGEISARDDYDRRVAEPQPPLTAIAPEAHQVTKKGKAPSAQSGSLAQYTAIAMARSPELKAAFARWNASVHRVSRARRLPEPMVTFGYFIQSVETRVGPQRAKIGLSQTFPWPTKLSAGSDAGSAQARAQARKVDALALSLRRRVADAYFRLWLVRESRAIHVEHLDVIRALSETVLARLATGATNLAAHQQVALAAARLEDIVAGMGEIELAAEAQLNAVLGARGELSLQTTEGPPEGGLPVESEHQLMAAAKVHPMLLSFDELAQAQEKWAESSEAEGMPSFSLGADWIIVDQAMMPGVEDSGKDALMVGAGMTIPLWRGNYSDSATAARAEASAARSERASAEIQAIYELKSSLSAVRDAVRRMSLYRYTLVPQAEAAYAAVLGAYSTGEGSVAQTLLAQRDLLELRDEISRARADYGQAWARLEQVVGHEVRAEAEEVDGRKKASIND